MNNGMYEELGKVTHTTHNEISIISDICIKSLNKNIHQFFILLQE